MTVAFYKALHVVEALLARDSKTDTNHTTDHKQRAELLKTTNRYQQIWKHYRPLWNDSLIARYLHNDSGGEYSNFSDYLSNEKIQNKHLNHNLKKIIESARTLLKDQNFMAEPEATSSE